MSLIERLHQHADQRGEQDALVTGQGTISYRQLLQLVKEAIGRLTSGGLGPGRVVGLAIADEVMHLVTALALLSMRTNQITLSTFDTDEVRADLAARCGVEAVVEQQRVVPFAPRIALGLPEGGLYLRTSGTTGRPGIVAVSLDQLFAQAAANGGYESHRLACLASVEHNNAKRHRLYTLINGGTNVLRAPRDAGLVDFCLRYGVTCLDIAPIHAAGLVATLEGRPLDSLIVRVSSSLVPPMLRSGLEARVTRQVSVRYGATECGTIAVTEPGEHGGATVGRSTAGTRVKVVNAVGSEVPFGESGEILARTTGMAFGYLDDPYLTALRFRDGWFWTGDIGLVGADGTLVVAGRRDDMMILNGINIFPAEIEETLERHGEVRAAAAAAIHSETHGDIPVAIVELRVGSPTTVAELLAFARQHLALRAPRRIAIVEEIPRNSQGKVQRHKVLEAVMPGRQNRG